MRDGIYQYALAMTVPIGLRWGRLSLNICGGGVGGTLTLFRQTLPISGGSCRGSKLRFSGEMKTLRYPLSYTAEGTISQGAVRLRFSTPKGRFWAEGTAITEEGGVNAHE